MFEWIKKHKALFIIICVMIFIALIGVPFAINLLFKVDTKINVFQAEWSAGDALGYYGAVLSFLGTVILGALALYQNHIIKEEADKKAALLEEKEHIENMPKFHLRFSGCSGFGCGLSFIIKNISNNISYDIKIYDIRIQEFGKTLWESSKEFTGSSLDSKGELNVHLDSPQFNDKKELRVIACMSCKDKYSDSHEYLLRINCVYPNNYDCEDIKELA
ncbi:MAG: hypothetical protein IKY78_03440 [Clostridia bacterium]|nr:hypothetical protein [Clostridia bacterium]